MWEGVAFMFVVITALFPVAILLALGFLLRRSGFFPEDTWLGIERLAYFVFIPCFLIHAFGQRSLDLGSIFDLMLGLWGTTLFVAVCLWASVRWFLRAGPATFTSLFQGSIRPNNFLGLAIAAGLWGEDGATFMAAAAGLIVLLVNALSVGTLSACVPQTRGKRRLVQVCLDFFKNPIILACVGGIALNISQISLPSIVMQTLGLLGGAALPLVLLIAGAGLQFGKVEGGGVLEGVAITIKLLALPALGFAITTVLGLGGVERDVIVLMLALPAPASAYVLARQMGGNAPLMARIISLQTIASFLTLPAVLLATGLL